MSSVASRSEKRRRLLARRVAALETMEPRAMITEGLFSLSLGAITSAAALHGALKAGTGHGTTHEAAKLTHHPRHGADPAAVPQHKPHHGGGGGSIHHAAVIATPKPAPTTGDWLTLANPADPPTISAVPTAPAKGGGALGGGGGGPDGAGTIRPVRFSPPQDLSGASSSVIAAAGWK